MRKIYLIAEGEKLEHIIDVFKDCLVNIKNKSIRRNKFSDNYKYLYEIIDREKEEFRENIIIEKGEWELLLSEVKKLSMELKNSESRLNEIKKLIKLR